MVLAGCRSVPPGFGAGFSMGRWLPNLVGARLQIMKLPDILAEEDGFIRVVGHRIGLQHIVRFYSDGYSVEMLIEQFPTLSLPLIHKLIAFYLENQAEVDAYVARCDAEFDAAASSSGGGPELAEQYRHGMPVLETAR